MKNNLTFKSKDKSFLEKVDLNSKNKLVNFFQILLKIDKRNNPHIYEQVFLISNNNKPLKENTK
jgi:hypothetical protein